MLRLPICCFLFLLLRLPPAAAQVTYTAAVSGGSAFKIDTDDPDPGGSYSLSAALQRRVGGKAFSLGLEAGLHRYLVIRQDLPPDPSGWSSVLEDTRTAWRITPFARWQTRGPDLHVYGQAGAGLYVEKTSYFQQERVAGVLALDTSWEFTETHAGLNLGAGLSLLPGNKLIGIEGGLRAHSVFGGDGFLTGELGILVRWEGAGRRAGAGPP